MALDGFLFHEHTHLLFENTGSFREFLLLSLWNLTSNNLIWCSLTPILRKAGTQVMGFVPSMVYRSLSYPLLAVLFRLKSLVYSATLHGEAVPYPWSSILLFSNSTVSLCRYEGKTCLQHSKNWSTMNSGIMMLSVSYSFLNIYFFQPQLNTDIFITTPMSSASHEVDGTSLLDFSSYDLEKPNIIMKFCHFIPCLFFHITYEYVDQHRYMGNISSA